MLSAVILTKNEERHIIDCIESLSFCSEIIVVDDFSEDRTLDVVKNTFPNVKIFKRKLDFNFAQQRNFGLSKATNDWVLFIDVDERVPKPLAEEIIEVTKSPSENVAYKIRRVDVLWGKQLQYGETGNTYLIRLGKKDAGKWIGKVHEIWHVKGNVGELEKAIIHYPHPTVAEFLKEINFYTTLRAQELYDKKVKTKWWEIILYPKGKFLVNFFLKRGFMDGIPGLLLALIMSFHSFLVRAKLWLLWEKENS